MKTGVFILFACLASAASWAAKKDNGSIGKVDDIQGEPTVKRGEKKTTLQKGVPIFVGDIVQTPIGAKIRVTLKDKSVVAIGANSEVKFADLSMKSGGRKGALEVAVGRFWMNVTKWVKPKKSFWEISTPNAVAGVRGTTLWGDTDVDAICALEGAIEVTSKTGVGLEPAKLSAGNCSSELSQGKLTPLVPTPEQVQNYLNDVMIK